MFEFRSRLLASALPLALVAAAAAVGMAVIPATPASASATDRLFTEPKQGFSEVYQLISGARKSIDMTMYQLADTTAERRLAAAASRGVAVRVILDGYQREVNSAAYRYLNSHGVHTVWSSKAYYYTHEKAFVVDDATAVIMTANLTTEYYPTSRDFGIIDTNARDVAAIERVFRADYAHRRITPGDGADLVWSPTDAQRHLLALINGATSSLKIYANEMDDTAIENALVSAADRGVKVEVVGENEDGEYDSAYTKLADAGVKISYFSSDTGFYIHAKAILADYGTSRAKVFVGSENFSNTSLRSNRELGLIIRTRAVMSSIASTFAADFRRGTRWS